MRRNRSRKRKKENMNVSINKLTINRLEFLVLIANLTINHLIDSNEQSENGKE